MEFSHASYGSVIVTYRVMMGDHRACHTCLHLQWCSQLAAACMHTGTGMGSAPFALGQSHFCTPQWPVPTTTCHLPMVNAAARFAWWWIRPTCFNSDTFLLSFQESGPLGISSKSCSPFPSLISFLLHFLPFSFSRIHLPNLIHLKKKAKGSIFVVVVVPMLHGDMLHLGGFAVKNRRQCTHMPVINNNINNIMSSTFIQAFYIKSKCSFILYYYAISLVMAPHSVQAVGLIFGCLPGVSMTRERVTILHFKNNLILSSPSGSPPLCHVAAACWMNQLPAYFFSSLVPSGFTNGGEEEEREYCTK